MCYEQHTIYAGCHCEYKAWQKCDTAKRHDEIEKLHNDRAVAEGRTSDVKYTPSPCIKSLKYDDQPYTWACPNCKKGKDPLLPGEVGEGKIVPELVGKRIVDEWDGTYGTPENHA